VKSGPSRGFVRIDEIGVFDVISDSRIFYDVGIAGVGIWFSA
jgi:hypothetical protein